MLPEALRPDEIDGTFKLTHFIMRFSLYLFLDRSSLGRLNFIYAILNTSLHLSDSDADMSCIFNDRIEDHLSLSWETRKHKKARAEKAERIRLAKEAAAKRLFEENMNRYRTPFMGF